jgi:hypothetical protein
MERTLRWVWFVSLTAIIAGSLVNLGFLVLNVDIPKALYRLVSVRSQYNLAAVAVTVIEIVAGLIACSYGMRRPGGWRAQGAWLIVGGGLIALGLADLTHLQSRIGLPRIAQTPVAAALGVVGLLATLRVTRDLWPDRRARRLWLIAIVLLLTNPATEAWKHSLSSDPLNYQFVAFGQPWRFSPAAWRDLHSVELLQESTEELAALLLFASLAAVASTSPREGAFAAPIAERSNRPLARVGEPLLDDRG